MRYKRELSQKLRKSGQSNISSLLELYRCVSKKKIVYM